MHSRSEDAEDDIARTLMMALRDRRQIPCLTDTNPGLGLDRAYRIADRVTALRIAGGERPVGRKIGFTNTTIWDEYGVHAPIWGMVYDSTLRPAGAPFMIGALVEPRIEPEILFRLSARPEPGMDDAALMGCIDAVAHGFELVQSPFAGWRFRAADTVAAFGLHGALIHGPFVPVGAADRDGWRTALASFRITLLRDGVAQDEGEARNVLGGGPLAALAHLVRVLDAMPGAAPLSPGEIITTGTVTRALPVAPGSRWSTVLHGLPMLGGIELTLI